MKKSFAFTLVLILPLLLCACGNNQLPDDSPNTDIQQIPSNNATTASPSLVKRVWDWHHPDDSEKNPYFSISVDSLDGALIEYKKDSKIYVNGEYLLGGPGNGCESFYLADITGDGNPELCVGMNLGSGIVDCRITVIDYETTECLFSLSDRMQHDYFLFARDGVLCVMETEYMKREPTRTGMLIYDGSKISVAWDNEVNASYDRDK